MQTDILERIRVLEGTVERRRDAIVEQRLLPITDPRHGLARDRFIAEQTRHLADDASHLLDLYLDGDELPAIQDEVMPLDAMMGFFNARVASIREYYRTHAAADDGEPVEEPPIEMDVDALIENGLFAHDEHYGKRLSLGRHHAAFDRFLVRCGKSAQLRDAAKRLRDRYAHIDKFVFNPSEVFGRTPQSLKLCDEGAEWYASFVTDLRAYLTNFHSRARPLQAHLLAAQLKEAAEAFDGYWAQVEAAAPAASYSAANSNNGGDNAFRAAAVPRDHPFLLAAWDLSTVDPTAVTAFAAAADEETDNANTSTTATNSGVTKRALARRIALLEAEVAALCLPPSGVLSALVRSSAEAQQEDRSKVPAERQREEDEAEEAFLDSLEAMGERLLVIRNKGVPIAKDTEGGDAIDLALLSVGGGADAAGAGASSVVITAGGAEVAAVGDRIDLNGEGGAFVDEDGNEIPAWQVKLEGRRKRFTCEVCAGAVYCGPKEYKEHFRFSRHTEGLRRLGIVNTRPFDGVASITGALSIAESMKALDGDNLLRRIAADRSWAEVEAASGMVLRQGELDRIVMQQRRTGGH